MFRGSRVGLAGEGVVKLKLFDDWGSWAHFALGILYAFAESGLQIAILLSYLMYQYIDEDVLGEKLGDIVEFLAGVLVGYATKYMLVLLYGIA